jgi:hypothetical protein
MGGNPGIKRPDADCIRPFLKLRLIRFLRAADFCYNFLTAKAVSAY